MALWYESLQIADDAGQPTGRWRFTYRSDESAPRQPVSLCQCDGGHMTAEAARACPVAQRSLPPEMRDREPDPQDVTW